jgi:MoxR-like ATPase
MLVENYENFNLIHKARFHLPSQYESPLVIYRGDKNESSNNTVMHFLKHVDLPELAYVDIDPAGLVIASKLPTLKVIVAPNLETLEKLLSSTSGFLSKFIEFKTKNNQPGDEKFEYRLIDRQNIENFLIKYKPEHKTIKKFMEYRIEALKKSDDNQIPHLKVDGSQNKPLNQILYGPPGTGKTYETAELAVQICAKDFIENESSENYRASVMKRYAELSKKDDDNCQISFVTFHQSYGYEEFVEGLRPVIASAKDAKEIATDADSTDVSVDDSHTGNTTPADGNDNTKGQVQYEIRPGAFKTICEKAKQNSKKNYVIIIDEINRGNISKILGELITLVEEDKREGEVNTLSVTLPYSQDSFSVPKNVYIIGTMNTADRSLAQVDIALRRRFHFIEMKPEPVKVLDDDGRNPLSVNGISISAMLLCINKRIEALYDRDHTIGHAYFTKLIGMSDAKGFEELQEIFKNKIIPLLQEYFFDDWQKIRLILGGAFISEDSINEDLFFKTIDDGELNLADKKIYSINEKSLAHPDSYKAIYEKSTSTSAPPANS